MTHDTLARRVARETLADLAERPTLDSRAKSLVTAWHLLRDAVRGLVADDFSAHAHDLVGALADVELAVDAHWTPEHATDVLTADYRDDVRDVARGLCEAVLSGEVESADDAEERLRESVDGSQRVIYTWQARCGLLASSNADEWYNEGGESHEGPSTLMFYAMRRDVRDLLPDELLDADAYEAEEDDDEVGT